MSGKAASYSCVRVRDRVRVRVRLEQPEGEEQRGGGDDGGRVVRHLVLGQAELHHVHGEAVLLHVHVPGLGEPPEEVELQRPGDVEAGEE